jgi:hypothetical protein
MHQPCIRLLEQAPMTQEIQKQAFDAFSQSIELKLFGLAHFPKSPSLDESSDKEPKGNDHQ